MRIVHLASGLGPTASARNLSRLVPALAAPGNHQLVLNLGQSEPFADELRTAGIAVRAVRFRNWLDWTKAGELRGSVREFCPDVVHVWGARAAVLANWLSRPGAALGPPLIVTDAKPDVGWSRRLLDRTNRLAAVARDSRPLSAPSAGRALSPADFGFPADTKMIVNVGGFDERSDALSAVAAFDILKHTLTDIHLLLVGDGPTRRRVAEFATRVGYDFNRVRFAGFRSDVPEIVSASSLVLVTHRTGGGLIAREALAAGKRVVGWRTPDLSTVIADGQTGALVPIGDPAHLATAMYRILTGPVSDPEMITKTGTGSDNISCESAAREWLEVYQSAMGGKPVARKGQSSLS